MPKRIWIALSALVFVSFGFSAYKFKNVARVAGVMVTSSDFSDSAVVGANVSDTEPTLSPELTLLGLYEKLDLQSLKLNHQGFDFAVKGYLKLQAQGKIKNQLLTIVDFSQPSTNKIMYILDVKQHKLLKQTHVAHGRNTGALMANDFSNVAESFQSSLGFYVTSETYIGKHGLSLRLDGMEKNINCQARPRAIVVHGAEYANEAFYKSTGYLGRSYGCPAVPTKDANYIINTIKNGTCLFLYSPDKGYQKQSSLI